MLLISVIDDNADKDNIINHVIVIQQWDDNQRYLVKKFSWDDRILTGNERIVQQPRFVMIVW